MSQLPGGIFKFQTLFHKFRKGEQIWYADRPWQVPSHRWQHTPNETWSGPRVITGQIFKFYTPSVNLEWMEKLARNFKFGTRIDLSKSHLTDDRNTPKGGVGRVRAEFLI